MTSDVCADRCACVCACVYTSYVCVCLQVESGEAVTGTSSVS